MSLEDAKLAYENIPASCVVARSRIIESEVRYTTTKSYILQIKITKDENAVYSAVILNLPGIGGCGESYDNALSDAVAAFHAALPCYDGIIPFTPIEFEPECHYIVIQRS